MIQSVGRTRSSPQPKRSRLSVGDPTWKLITYPLTAEVSRPGCAKVLPNCGRTCWEVNMCYGSQPNLFFADYIQACSQNRPQLMTFWLTAVSDDAPAYNRYCWCQICCSQIMLQFTAVSCTAAEADPARSRSCIITEAVPSNPVIRWLHDHGMQTVLIRASIIESLMFTIVNRHSSPKTFLCCLPYPTAFVPDH